MPHLIKRLEWMDVKSVTTYIKVQPIKHTVLYILIFISEKLNKIAVLFSVLHHQALLFLNNFYSIM